MNGSILNEYGIDYKGGLARCMNDEAFYEKFLKMVLKDDSFQRTKAAYEARDQKRLFECAHELKGVSGNAAMTEVFEAVCPLVECVREQQGSFEEIDVLFAKLEEAYNKAYKGVTLALAE